MTETHEKKRDTPEPSAPEVGTFHHTSSSVPDCDDLAIYDANPAIGPGLAPIKALPDRECVGGPKLFWWDAQVVPQAIIPHRPFGFGGEGGCPKQDSRKIMGKVSRGRMLYSRNKV